MLTLILFSILVHISAVPMILKPLRNLTINKKTEFDAKSLVEELSNANPAQIQQLQDLIETMLLAAHTNVDKLEIDSNNANNDYDAAAVTADAAVLSFVGAQNIFNIALEATIVAREARDIAEGRKIEAQTKLDALKPDLEKEIKTLEDMISLHETLNWQSLEVQDQIQAMLVSAHNILNNLILESINANKAYDTAVTAYDASVLVFNEAQEKLRVAQEAVNVAQQAKDVAEGAKIAAQHSLDIEKPNLEVEISNLEEMLRIHGSLNPDRYTVLDEISCGFGGDCGSDNQLYIGANGERWTSTDENANNCKIACDQTAECGGFNYVRSHGKCYYRRLATCSQTSDSDRVCYVKNENHFTLRAKTGNGKWDATSEKVMVSFYVKNVWTVPVVFFQNSALDQVKSMEFSTSELPSKVKLSIGGSDGWRFTNIYIKMVVGKEYFFSTSTAWIKGTENSAIEMNVLPASFDFESGSLDGWTLTGTAFNNQPTYGDNPTARNRGQISNHEGNWWIGTYENCGTVSGCPSGAVQGDGLKGTATSPVFKLTGTSASFLIGGGNYENEQVELIVGGVSVLKSYGNKNEHMQRETWDISPWTGQSAQLKLVDAGSGGWGHINFDDWTQS